MGKLTLQGSAQTYESFFVPLKLEMQERIIIVSNRLPYKIEKKNGKYQLRQSSGGLVSAIQSVSKNKRVVWVGAADFKEELWEELKKTTAMPEINIVPLFLNKKTEDFYYNGFSNSIIWPLFHYFPSFTEYNTDFYNAYVEVNKIFASAIKSIAKENETVWIHDYHLMLLPGFLKQESQPINSSFFLHIPFPSYELFRLIPEEWRNNILKSLLCCDVVGFHTEQFVYHFKKSLEVFLGLQYKDDQISIDGHTTKIKDYPISIDFEKFHSAYDNPQIAKSRELIRNKYPQTKIIFSLDRLDYSKGVINRLQAYEQLLRKNSQLYGNVVLIINIIPSREEINTYAERKTIIEENIARINGLYGNFLWQPIVYQYQHLSFDVLLACYTACDVALVTPLRDGMNLIAKEFVASRKDKRGSLVLSEFAGAANELKEALLVNPNDINTMQLAILKAFKMKPTEQEKRMSEMQNYLQKNDVNAWSKTYLKDMKDIKQLNENTLSHQMNFEDKVQIIESYQRSTKRLLLLDYDGTLVRFYDKPQDAVPDNRVKELLASFAENPFNKVVIVSGRDATTLDKWLGHLNINIAAEHGLKYKEAGNKNWVNLSNKELVWKDKVRELAKRYSEEVVGSFVEEKEHTIAWHYRTAEDKNIEEHKTQLSKELIWLNKENEFDILLGNKVLEVKSNHQNKGTFTQNILAKNHFDFVLSIGDDLTDEDMFAVLQEKHHFTIKVGLVPTCAKFNLLNINVVLSFLEQLSLYKNGHRQ
jgi:trehalose 6-phosphate synthase/phosphatase